MTFRNRSAAFVWGFVAIWLAMLVAMTYLVLRDGPPPGYSAPTTATILGLFWLGGLALIACVSRQPCISVTVGQHGSIAATWRYPHKVVRRVLPAGTVLPAKVVDAEDSEGGPYFRVRLRASGGETIDIAEGHSRADCERTCELFNSALDAARFSNR